MLWVPRRFRLLLLHLHRPRMKCRKAWWSRHSACAPCNPATAATAAAVVVVRHGF